MEKDILYFDLDGVMADFNKKLIEINPNMPHVDHPDRKRAVDEAENTPKFYRSLEPIPGAIEAFKTLSTKYENYILSTASWDNPCCWREKREWVEEHLGIYGWKKLILSHNKGLLIGKYLIDDRIKNGVDKFQGEHIHFGTEKFPNWDTVLKYLMYGSLKKKYQ